jgi:hypothetical protein
MRGSWRTVHSVAVLISAILLSAPASGTQIYKCVDENGRIVFSQYPCGPKSEAIELRELAPAPSSEVEHESARQKLDKLIREQEERRAVRIEEEQKKRAEREAKKQEKIMRQQRCELARQNLQALLTQRPVYRSDAQGERMYLDDEERQSELQRALAEFKEFCH